MSIFRDRSFRLASLLTVIFFGTGIIFLFAGLADYSWILFILLPIVLGISLGAMPDRKFVLVGAIATAVLILVALFIQGLSGLLCVVMSLPLIVSMIFMGYVISFLIKRYRQWKSTTNLPVLLLPLIPFLIGAPLEHFFNLEKKEIISVTTEQVFPYTPQQVYDAIKSVDTLIAPKPYLMQFDLPIPVKCVLEKEEVGGLRTCYFRSGRMSNADFGSGVIVERITELRKAEVLKMDVVSYNLVGRKWIGFNQAIYYFTTVGDTACKLTRITTYTSELNPRFYWEPLEKLGIRQEHDYVFANLANDLRKTYGR